MKLYVHERNTDIAFEIISKTLNEETNKYELTVVWWNIGPHTPWCMNIVQTLYIDKQKFEDEWHVYVGKTNNKSV